MNRFPLLLAFPFALLSGCGVSPQGVARVATQFRRMVSLGNKPALDNAYLASLSPIRGVKGIVVGEPKAQNVADSAFGAGCARWLQVQVGGQSELGTTPAWGQLEDARRLRGLSDWRLDQKNGLALLGDVGASHVALGTFQKGQLAFQLGDASGKNFGAPLQVRGSNAQIAAQLPALARQMAMRLGVSHPDIPALSLSAADVAFLGGLPRRSPVISAPQKSRLNALATHDALAGILRARVGTAGTNWRREQLALYSLAPHNALVLADLLDADANVLRPHLPAIDAFVTAHPNNFALALGEERRRAQSNNAALRVAACERLMRLAPNEMSFFELSEALGAQGDSIRRGAFFSDMTPTQKTQVEQIYPRREAVATRGVQLFPRDAALWASLSEAATFNGDDALAKSSLNKAASLDPSQAKTWNWGVQFFQPKWGDSKAQVVAWCKRAAQNAGHCRGEVDASQIEAALDTPDVGAGDQVEPILTIFVANDPTNAAALRELGARYQYYDHAYRRAEAMYRRSLAVNPGDSRTLGFLADITQFVHGDAKGAGQLYFRAIQLNPGDGYAHANYARWLHLSGRPQAAIGEAKLAVRSGYSDGSHPVWELTGVHP